LERRLGLVDKILTAAAAQELQNRGDLIWFVYAAGPEHEGGYIARPHTADHHGGEFLQSVLGAPTLAELRSMAPIGLFIEARVPLDPPDVLESWWAG
jgi:hypothetical protein